MTTATTPQTTTQADEIIETLTDKATKRIVGEAMHPSYGTWRLDIGKTRNAISETFAPVTVKAALADELAESVKELRHELYSWMFGAGILTLEELDALPIISGADELIKRYTTLTASPLSPETEAEGRQALAAEDGGE